MFKLLFTSALCVIALSACEKQKEASAAVGAVPKQIIDKATKDVNNAAAISDRQLKAVESETSPTDAEK